MPVLRGVTWRRFVAGLIQIGLATLLAVSHLFTETTYIYSHYVLLTLGHPILVRRTLGLRLSAWQIGYISLAMTLHPLGGLYQWYEAIWWFDHGTHTLSATLVAAIGYTLVRAYDLRGGSIPSAVPAFTIAFVMTGGIIGEVVELHVDWLTVYSYNDTIRDYLFNTVGGLLVIVTGRWTLDEGTRQIAGRGSAGPGPGGGGTSSRAVD